MRPHYETNKDLEREGAFREKIEGFLGYSLEKLPIRYGFDFGIYDEREELHGIVEVKNRSHKKEQYRTFILAFQKFQQGLQAQQIHEQVTGEPLKVFLFVRFEDSDAFALIRPPMRYACKRGGRKDRGDELDIEPVIHIPITKFREF